VYQVLDAPRQPPSGNLSPFKRLYRACTVAACLIVAFIAVLPSLVLTFLALAGAVWIKQFF
jgi:Flp pilus assembly protein TadB